MKQDTCSTSCDTSSRCVLRYRKLLFMGCLVWVLAFLGYMMTTGSNRMAIKKYQPTNSHIDWWRVMVKRSGQQMSFATCAYDYMPLDIPKDKPGLPAINENISEATKLAINALALRRNSIPAVAIYVWCNKEVDQSKVFEFRHYLSMKSFIKFLIPDAVYFYHGDGEHDQPAVDKWRYNSWFNDLTIQFPFLVVKEVSTEKLCDADGQPNSEFLEDIIQNGGLYVNENTLLTRYPSMWMNQPFKIMSVSGSSCSLYGKRVGGVEVNQHVETFGQKRCVSAADYKSYNVEHTCVDLSGLDIHPRDYLRVEDEMSQLVRTLMYNRPDMYRAKPNDKPVIPKIAHYIWFGENIGLIFYLSILSSLYVLELEDVYIHGDSQPTGYYWDKLQSEKRIKWIHRVSPKLVFGGEVMSKHRTELVIPEIMLQYGGVYVSPTVLFQRKFDDDYWLYDMVGSPAVSLDTAFPSVASSGIFLVKPNAEFMFLIQHATKLYKRTTQDWNLSRTIYKLYERAPDLIHLCPWLLIECQKSGCIKKYEDSGSSIGGNPRLKTDEICDDAECLGRVYQSLQFTKMEPKDKGNLNSLLSLDTLLAKNARRIMRASGSLE